MTLTVTSQTINDGPRNCIVHFTGVSDGSGVETNVVKVDPSTLNPPAKRVSIRKIGYDVADGSVKLSWEGSPNKDVYVASNMGEYKYRHFNAIPNTATGRTGRLLFSTIDTGPSFTYTITLELIKKYK